MTGKIKRYNDGDRVCALVRPQVPLIVRIYANKVYYCNVEGDEKAKEQVHFERELKPYVK